MYDHDVFAVLIPYDTRNKANSAFKLAHNVKWFQPAVGGVAQSATIESREPTPARDSQLEEEEKESGGAVDRLVLTFSKLMQLEGLRDGVQAGTSTATSHILLGHRGTRGVSARHYRIAVDDEMRIWLHDHSMHGTAVGYGGQNMDQVRVGETWLLADAPGTANIFSPTTIDSGGLIVAIDFPNHQGRDAQYLENLCALIEKSKENEVPGVQGLGLDSQPTTEPPSEAQTVSDRLIYFKHREIGSGAFGRVFKIIRARDGKVLAGKVVTPPPTNSQKRRRGEVDPAWLLDIRREYTIMKDNPHVFGMREWPEIMIVMPYFPSGNIAQAGVSDESKLVTAFGQLLDCLTFLHERRVTHRDIKPDNVLIELVPRFKVVLSDFGLSKVVTDTTLLQTFCGTLKYLAPEVFPFSKVDYGPPADMWSLGVMALEWLYGIPVPPAKPAPRAAQKNVSPGQWRTWAETWVDMLIMQLDDQEEGTDIDLLQGMFAINQERRLTARKGLMKGLKDGLFTRRAVDGLVACAVGGQEEEEEKAANVAGGVEPPTATQRADAEDDPDATILLSRLGGGVPDSSGELV
ncbi:hypothetical protein RB595_007658 [Gaeumannomyces hyphopodioides]